MITFKSYEKPIFLKIYHMKFPTTLFIKNPSQASLTYVRTTIHRDT